MSTYESVEDAVRDLLSKDEEGRAIKDKISTDPIAGAALLLEKLKGDDAPRILKTTVEGGNIGYIVNVASEEAALTFGSNENKYTPSYIEERLRLGWQLFYVAMLLSAAGMGKGAAPADFQVRQAFFEISEVFGVDIAPPLTPMPPRNLVDWVAHRLEVPDAVGANVFRLGAMINLWWQFKGWHGAEMDDELWLAVDGTLEQLDYLFSGVRARVTQSLRTYGDGKSDEARTQQMISGVARAVVNKQA